MNFINQKKTQAEGDKLRANIRQELEGKKCSKTFFKVLERHNIQYQTIFKLYTDDDKSKYPSNPTDILRSARKFVKNPTERKQSFSLTASWL